MCGVARTRILSIEKKRYTNTHNLPLFSISFERVCALLDSTTWVDMRTGERTGIFFFFFCLKVFFARHGSLSQGVTRPGILTLPDFF